MAAAALEAHRSSPAVQQSAHALQEQIRAAWQNSAWLDDDEGGADLGSPSDAAGAAAAMPLAALQWATRGPASGADSPAHALRHSEAPNFKSLTTYGGGRMVAGAMLIVS